jgi:hypothetical protein
MVFIPFLVKKIPSKPSVGGRIPPGIPFENKERVHKWTLFLVIHIIFRKIN